MPRRLQGTLLTSPINYCPTGVQGTVLGITVDLSALPYLLRPFLGPHRAGIPDRLVLVGSDYASQRRAVSRGSVHPRSEGGPELEASTVPFWPGLLVRDWIALLACRLGIWAGPGVYVSFARRLLGRAFARKPIHEGPRVYEPDRGGLW